MRVALTERLVIRWFRREDADFVVRLLNEPTFIEHIADRGVRTPDQAVAYLEGGPLASCREHGHGLYLVARRNDLAPLGMCGLVRRDFLSAPDLGYAFLPEHVGKGYAFEAGAAVLEHGRRDLGMERCLAIVNPGNRRSIGLLERLGFGRRGLILPPGREEEVALYEVARG
jgi:RimJ/RimL family protein N-acetyltransferase